MLLDAMQKWGIGRVRIQYPQCAVILLEGASPELVLVSPEWRDEEPELKKIAETIRQIFADEKNRELLDFVKLGAKKALVRNVVVDLTVHNSRLVLEWPSAGYPEIVLELAYV